MDTRSNGTIVQVGLAVNFCATINLEKYMEDGSRPCLSHLSFNTFLTKSSILSFSWQSYQPMFSVDLPEMMLDSLHDMLLVIDFGLQWTVHACFPVWKYVYPHKTLNSKTSFLEKSYEGTPAIFMVNMISHASRVEKESLV